METHFPPPHTHITPNGNEKVSGGFAGTPANMCWVQGTVNQTSLICSELLCLRGGKQLLCHFSTQLTDPRTKCKLTSVSSFKNENDWCLLLRSLAFFVFIFLTAIHTPGLGQSIRFFWVLSEEHARSSFKSMHYFYYNYFIAPSHKEYSIIMAYRSSKSSLISVYLVHCL